MTKILILLCYVLLMPTNAHALPAVLCYGDSLTGFPGAPPPLATYPESLQVFRPNLTIYNRGQPGDSTPNISRFDLMLAERSYAHVVILLGANDSTILPPITPHQSFLNLWTMATHAKNAGAEVWLLTPTPVDSRFAGNSLFPTSNWSVRQPYTRDLANELAHRDLANSHSHVHFVYLRDVFTNTPWPPLSTEGLHTNQDGADVIGAFVADALP